MADEIIPLNEQFENVDARWGDWNGYKTNYFVRLAPQARANELLMFSRALNEEAYSAKGSKEFAEHWTRRRELERLDDMMKRAGR